MKLGWKDIDAFVKKPNPKARAILVYGPDDGLVKERALTMARASVSDINDPFNVAILSGDILSDDPARLSDEANAMSLMGGARLVRVEGASDKHTTIFKEYLANPSSENLIILEAGELGTKSTLRALFEKSDSAAAVPLDRFQPHAHCRQDAGRNLTRQDAVRGRLAPRGRVAPALSRRNGPSRLSLAPHGGG